MPSGGKRKGAGRKCEHAPYKKKMYGAKLDPRIISWLREHERPAAQLIEEALTNYFNIKL